MNDLLQNIAQWSEEELRFILYLLILFCLFAYIMRERILQAAELKNSSARQLQKYENLLRMSEEQGLLPDIALAFLYRLGARVADRKLARTLSLHYYEVSRQASNDSKYDFEAKPLFCQPVTEKVTAPDEKASVGAAPYVPPLEKKEEPYPDLSERFSCDKEKCIICPVNIENLDNAQREQFAIAFELFLACISYNDKKYGRYMREYIIGKNLNSIICEQFYVVKQMWEIDHSQNDRQNTTLLPLIS